MLTQVLIAAFFHLTLIHTPTLAHNHNPNPAQPNDPAIPAGDPQKSGGWEVKTDDLGRHSIHIDMEQAVRDGHFHMRTGGGLEDWDEDDWEDDEEDGYEPDNVLMRDGFVQNVEHMRAHLKDDIDLDMYDMSPGQMDYHFFVTHDENEDDMLDGLELLHAIQDALDEQYDHILAVSDPVIQQRKKHMFNTKSWLSVDRILREADKNNDGYISWQEFKTSRMIAHNNAKQEQQKRPRESKGVHF